MTREIAASRLSSVGRLLSACFAIARVGAVKTAAARAGVAVAIAALATTGCGGGAPPPPQPPTVTVSSPVSRQVAQYAEFTGSTRAVESAEIRARVPGVLESIEFEPSTIVEKGQLLFTIERAPYRAARDQAQASLASARAELARAESDLERLKTAVKTNAVSQQDVDGAQAQRDQASAAVLGARASLDKAELDYSYTLVRSPIRGVASRRRVDVGNLVGSGENTLLTTVNKMQPIYVYFNAPERIVLHMLRNAQESANSDSNSREVARALVGLANEVGYPHEGVIDYIDNTVDPTTGTIELRAVIPNESRLFFPGLFVRVRLVSAELADAVLVDQRAVGTDLGGKYVYVVGEGNVVEQRYVTLGSLQDDGMIVVEEGLDGSETYISNGILRARPGLPVTPQRAEAPTAEAPAAGAAAEASAASSAAKAPAPATATDGS